MSTKHMIMQGRFADDQLFALTLQEPWAWCVSAKSKRIENRTWHPPALLSALGGEL